MDILHSELPTHCSMCGLDWPEDQPPRCPRCSATKCEADIPDEAEGIQCLGANNRLPPPEVFDV